MKYEVFPPGKGPKTWRRLHGTKDSARTWCAILNEHGLDHPTVKGLGWFTYGGRNGWYQVVELPDDYVLDEPAPSAPRRYLLVRNDQVLPNEYCAPWDSAEPLYWESARSWVKRLNKGEPHNKLSWHNNIPADRVRRAPGGPCIIRSINPNIDWDDAP